MAIGERIRFIRNLQGMTQKYLGTLVGFPEKTADIRMAQYESGTRTPKAELSKSVADALDVSPLALSVPDIDSYLGLMHTLSTLEDLYGLTIENKDGIVTFRFDPRKGKGAARIADMVTAWADVSAKYRNGDMSRDDYDTWRYRYPAHDETQNYVKVPSQALSDALVEAFKEKIIRILQILLCRLSASSIVAADPRNGRFAARSLIGINWQMKRAN